MPIAGQRPGHTRNGAGQEDPSYWEGARAVVILLSLATGINALVTWGESAELVIDARPDVRVSGDLRLAGR